ncbi:MAG: Smr/MutS family protein [Arenicellales bacterium]
MSGGDKDDLDDSDLFRQAMEKSGVRPAKMRPDKISHSKKYTDKPIVSRRQARAIRSATIRAVKIDQTTEGPQVLFVRAGINKATIRNLRNGSIPVEESIDLHGMRSHEATRALQSFLDESLAHDLDCIEIIHGKGQRSEQAGGVLKPMAIHWLKQQPEVLAFCSAIPSHGGSGATCALLSHTSEHHHTEDHQS